MMIIILWSWITYTSTYWKPTDMTFQKYASLPQFRRGATSGLHRRSLREHEKRKPWFLLAPERQGFLEIFSWTDSGQILSRKVTYAASSVFVDHFSRRRYSFLEIFNILQYANCFEIFQLATLQLATATKAGMRTQGIFFHYGHAAHQSGTQALKPAALRLWLAIEQWHPKLGLSKKCGQDKHSLWMLMVILNVDMMNTLGNLAWFVQPYDLIIHLFCTLLMSIIIQNSGVYPIISAS